ncbi:hypothetical protein KBZ18_15235 [Synechococcus sp. Cruz-9H2]|uniref:hypothetical protein n=1 Tax=unclassified Synechococcus TaxID=2626047 RepID=UPI0020CF9563|nr:MULTISPECIES: hypothetical protein [unclassified Synechococcus]MCP9820837.1 hypothetical protein [Synechococcus sp. Cruz-9H2]MCP9845091.1 hypothetical protein [Synechococcus sp. Edmonson 11F2]MCP9857193.1 hypothetical protein [Synechococcus sp. Cruz-9C9]MCP9864478.1 hypothetical protein [Synechococcus sp. Cruz-7E5]MCP9871747.1 hypothetical protein [Synechococcus sp. Cruz-7B9]
MNGSGDPPRRGRRRSGGSLDQWMSAGRQLVDGVAGARPGSRPQVRGAERRAGGRPGLEGLGRWVENRIDWFLEGDDDWPEPWQERAEIPERRRPPLNSDVAPWQLQSERQPTSPSQPQPQPPARASAPVEGTRRPLEAISRRTAPLLPPSRGQSSVQLPPVQLEPPPQPQTSGEIPPGARPLPRSSRRPRRE